MFRRYLRIVEKTHILKEKNEQELGYLYGKPLKDHVVWKKNKLKRLIKILQDKIDFYEQEMANLDVGDKYE